MADWQIEDLDATELWGDSEGRESVHVDVWERWLEPA